MTAPEPTLRELAAAAEDAWLWHEQTDEELAGYGHHMAQMLYRLPRDGQTDDMKASIEWLVETVTALLDRAETAEAERDAAQEHLAYHLRDYALNSELTGDLAVEMARYARRLKARAEVAEAKVARVEALADEFEHVGGGLSGNHFGRGWNAGHATAADRIRAALRDQP